MHLRFVKSVILSACLLPAPTAWAGFMPDAVPESGAPAGVFKSVAIPVSSFPAALKWKMLLPSVESADFAQCEARSDCAALGRVIREVSVADLPTSSMSSTEQ